MNCFISLFTIQLSASSVLKMSEDPDIIIVGAGIAGLTVANYLQKYNFKKIKILEASERIGGRLWTQKTSGLTDSESKTIGYNYVEMGSQRVIAGELMCKFAEEKNQILEVVPPFCNRDLGALPIYGRLRTSAIVAVKNYLLRKGLLYKDFNEFNVQDDPDFEKIFKGESESFAKVVKSYMKGTHQWLYGLAYSLTFPGLDKELLKGYTGLLEELSNSLSPGTIVLKKEVIAIDWMDFKEEYSFWWSSSTPKIDVLCKDDTIYEADHVIITVPIGYLKENYKTLFMPSLPDDKIKALEELNFETFNKIFLQFETPFWKFGDVFPLVWNEELDSLLDSMKFEEGKDLREWMRYVFIFEYVPTDSSYLCAWIWGDGAIALEDLQEKEIVEGCMILLQFLTKKTTFPKLKSTMWTKWHSNPFSRGSVVYDPGRFISSSLWAVKKSICMKEDLVNFHGPVCKKKTPLLLFTCDVGDSNLSSVDGAATSGLKVAKEIQNFYQA